MPENISFRIDDRLAAQLTARSSPGMSPDLIARRDLERYYTLLARSVPTFSEGEASLLCDALNGLMLEPHTASLLWASISDSLQDGLAEKWGVDGPALVARLRALTPFEALATGDAVERFWNLTPEGLPMLDALRRVGLVR